MSMNQVDAEVEMLVRAGLVGTHDQEKVRRILQARRALFDGIAGNLPCGDARAATAEVIKAIAALQGAQQKYAATLDDLEALAGDPHCEAVYARLKKSVEDFSSACQSLMPRYSISAEVIARLEEEISGAVRALQEELTRPSLMER